VRCGRFACTRFPGKDRDKWSNYVANTTMTWPGPGARPIGQPCNTALHDAYHGWKIWYVPLALGGLTWCAKRHADGTLFHAAGPADLAEYIGDAEAALRGDPPTTAPRIPEDA
jgi:hypothetical protein